MTRQGKLAHSFGRWIAGAAMLGLLAGPAVAQARKDAPAAAAQPRKDAPAAQPRKDIPPVAAGASPGATAPSQDAPVAHVTGFRSAKFGMTEAEVRAAIVRDLGVKPDAIKAEVNPSEQTPVLVTRATDILPGGGNAEVSYVFGFKSKTLIQVGITWSKGIDDKMTPEQLFSNSSVLRAYFMSAGYKPDTIASNMPINNGVLMFRGSDEQDRTTLLILQGPVTKGENDQRVLTPTALVLFYVANAKTPDVYRLAPGSF